MYAIRIHVPGGTEALVYEDVPVPTPGVGEVRVKVVAAGVNFIDVYQRMGLYPVPLPFTLGQEAAGIVDVVGPEVTGFDPGDPVAYAFQPGAYAEYAIVPAAKLVRVPPTIDLSIAAAVMLQGLTAHYLTHSTFPLAAQHTALVHAAAGGVGLLLIQMAKLSGARVLGTVSTEEKAVLARDAGADEVILYTQEDFTAAVRRLTDGRGVDVVYDSVGQTTFSGSLDCLCPRGYMVLFGQSSGPVAPFNLQELNSRGSLFITRPSLGHYVATRDELEGRVSDIVRWIEAGTLTVHIDRTLPLHAAAEAHQALESRATVGKVLLMP